MIKIDKKVLLASKSPRRRELLSLLRIPFTVISLDVKEHYPADLPPLEVAPYLSELKAMAYKEMMHDNELVITADTVVVLDNKIYEKPRDNEDAVRMLLELSDRTHTVVSGVTLSTKEKHLTFDCRTDVKFGHVLREEAEYYVDTFHPLDKAGAYGIQEWIGAVAVERIDGSFYNVMGLPVHQLYHRLKEFLA